MFDLLCLDGFISLKLKKNQSVSIILCDFLPNLLTLKVSEYADWLWLESKLQIGAMYCIPVFFDVYTATQNIL